MEYPKFERPLVHQPCGPLQSEVILRGMPTRPASLSGTPDALALLKALRRRWGLALVLGLLLAAVAGPAAWYVVPRDKYTAVATLQVATKPKRIIFEPRDGTTDFSTYQKTQVALFKDRSVISHAITKLTEKGVGAIPTLQEQPDPEGWLERQLKVEFVGGSEVLRVSLSGDRPKDIAAIVNQMIDSYMELVVDKENDGSRRPPQAAPRALGGLPEQAQGEAAKSTRTWRKTWAPMIRRPSRSPSSSRSRISAWPSGN